MVTIFTLIPSLSIINSIINKKWIMEVAISTSILIFLYTLTLLLRYDYNIIEFQFFYKYGIDFLFGLDGIALILIILVAWLIPICLLTSYVSIKDGLNKFIILIHSLQSILLLTFILLNIFIFYIVFEVSLIPMFLLIGIFGNRHRKIYASFQFFLTTLFGSLFMLLSIIVIFDYYGSLNYLYLTSYIRLSSMSSDILDILWLGFFISFAIKTPMMPIHLWLSDAHTEANVSGSILLAGILLKLAGYGFIRYSIALLPISSIHFAPFIQILTTISILFSSFTTLRQIDLKKIIAYCSIGHMNLSIFSLFSNNFQGINGSLFTMISHGIVSPALFFSVGILYDRFHSRLFKYFKGIAIYMPLFVLFFFIFNLANMGVPLTSSFIGEFLSFIGIFQYNPFFFILTCLSLILSASYSIWLFNRISFGSFSYYIKPIFDINRREFTILFSFLFFIFLFGIFPNIILNPISLSTSNLLYLF